MGGVEGGRGEVREGMGMCGMEGQGYDSDNGARSSSDVKGSGEGHCKRQVGGDRQGAGDTQEGGVFQRMCSAGYKHRRNSNISVLSSPSSFSSSIFTDSRRDRTRNGTGGGRDERDDRQQTPREEVNNEGKVEEDEEHFLPLLLELAPSLSLCPDSRLSFSSAVAVFTALGLG